MSQGQFEFLDYKSFINKVNGTKSKHYKFPRIEMQGITGVDESYRLKATMLDKDIFCGHSVNYITLQNIDLPEAKFYLAVLNSMICNWFFKKFSTNSNVNSYEVHNLPINKKFNSKTFAILVDYLLFLNKDGNKNNSFFFEQLLDGIICESFFENEIKQAGCDILKFLNDLPEIKDEMDDEEKMRIITKVFNKLYDKKSPLCKNLEAMKQVEEVRIIKESLGK